MQQVLTTLETNTGTKIVLVALDLLPRKNKELKIKDFAVVKSAYVKEAIQYHLNSNSILYINPDKKRTDIWLARTGLQLPVGETKYGPVRKITYSDGKVKIENSTKATPMEADGEYDPSTKTIRINPNRATPVTVIKHELTHFLRKNGISVEYKKEDLSQVNPQLYEWLAIINGKPSSDTRIAETPPIVNTQYTQNGTKRFIAPDATSQTSPIYHSASRKYIRCVGCFRLCVQDFLKNSYKIRTHKAKSRYLSGFLRVWWSRGESNPCPKTTYPSFLRVQPVFWDSPHPTPVGRLRVTVVAAS